MPLKKPSRLPRRLNRPTSAYTLSLAKRFYGQRSRSRFKRLYIHSAVRRWLRFLDVFLIELRIWLIILGSLATIALVATLLFSPLFNVKEIRVRRQDARIDVGEVQQNLSPLLHERMFFVSSAQILSLLKAANPDVTAIQMDKRYPGTLTITIFTEPIIAEAKILDTDETTASGSGAPATSSLYVSAQGRLVVSPIALTKARLPTLTLTDWGTKPVNRSLILPPDDIRTIFSASDMLRQNFGLSIVRMLVYLRAREFHIQTNKVTLWFDLATPLPVQFQRFREFLKTLSLDKAKEYIDLRISDRVMYR